MNKTIIQGLIGMLVVCLAAACSKKQDPNPPEEEEELQLELRADETTVVAGSEITFEVTANGQPVADADLFIDGNNITGYRHTFADAGTTSVVAKKQGYKDSEPLTVVIEEASYDVDIYVLGDEGTEGLNHYQPLYWKNGEPNVFNHEAAADMIFNRIAIADNKIYAVGERVYSSSRATAFFEVDGHLEELTGSNGFASAKDIYVTDGDVYVGGIKNESSYVTSIVYWKNGALVTVASGALGSTGGGSIAVKGNDVYIAGMLDGDLMYWKNGASVTLAGGPGEVTDIAVAGNGDVYVSGYTFGSPDVAQYWKNGEKITLGTGERASQANAIFIENGDVYVAGWETVPRSSGSGTVRIARYWKNGEAVDLTDGTHHAEANGIFVLDGKVYTTGVESMDRRSATYWINGEAVRLSHEDNNGYASDIVVVKRGM